MSEEFEGTLRVRKWGDSYVICLPKEFREHFGIVHRDLIAFRKLGRNILLRRISGADLIPVTEGEARRRVVGAGGQRV